MRAESKKVGVGGGISFPMALGLLFVALKLCGVIDWSWWMVLLPIYAVPCVALAIAGVCLMIAGALHVFGK